MTSDSSVGERIRRGSEVVSEMGEERGLRFLSQCAGVAMEDGGGRRIRSSRGWLLATRCTAENPILRAVGWKGFLLGLLIGENALPQS